MILNCVLGEMQKKDSSNKLGANYLHGLSETLWQHLREQSTFLFSVIYLLGAALETFEKSFSASHLLTKMSKKSEFESYGMLDLI